MNSNICATLMSLAMLWAGAARAGTLSVHIDDVKAAQGTVMISLFNAADTFMKKPVASQALPALKEGVTAVFTDLPEGEYALAAYHDANGNGKLDMNLMGIPIEPYAFSNNAMGQMGPPTFAQAKFALPAGGADLRVSLR